MAPRGLVAALLCGLFAAAAQGAFSDAERGSALRSLLAAERAVSSPDVPLNGACAADIAMHCKHLLLKDAVQAALHKVEVSKAIVAASELGHEDTAAAVEAAQEKVVTIKETAAGEKAGTGADAPTGSHSATNASSFGAAASTTQAATGEKSAVAAGTTAATKATAAAGSTAAANTTAGATAAAGSTAGTAASAAAANTTAKAAAGATTGAAATGAAGGVAAAGATTGAGAAGATTAGAAAAGATTGAAAHGATAASTTAAVKNKAAHAGKRHGSHTNTALLHHKRAHAHGKQHTHTRQLLADANTAAIAEAKAAAAEAESMGAKAVLAELNAAEAQADDLGRALKMLGLQAGVGAGVLAINTAPIARCLSGVMHASEMSISPNVPQLADECKAEVRQVLIQRASDAANDPPLLAACAHDIVNQCDDIAGDSTAVLGCLKRNKGALLPGCRGAVTARQAAAAEDLSLDPDLQRHCGKERDDLCLEAGWGNGAAQACLLGHLRGTLPHVFSQVVFPTSASAASALAVGPAKSKDEELSANCSAALVQRLIEEGEDIRLNFRLASACAGDKQELCRDVRPGGAAVLGCLEDHIAHPDMSEECRDALSEVRQLRSLDVRLDHTFVTSCDTDVRSLCGEEEYGQLSSGPLHTPFGLAEPFECLRSKLDMVRDTTCRKHVYGVVVDAYQDNRLDAGLMRSCHAEIALLCSTRPGQALECLRDKIDKFSREDSPAALKGKISDPCMTTVLGRQLQAATDVAFEPRLMQACAREHATFCAAPELEDVRSLDCLADNRNSPDFSERCADALGEYLARAARDVRTMAGLQEDCGEEIKTLCKGVEPGEGRVIACLRAQRGNITGELCRRQVLRLLGFMVEDHRVDSKLVQACTSDVQKYCAGVPVGDGQVHDCLRRSIRHLEPACRAAEEEVERLGFEDVRLNPKLMRECPLAISSFCPGVTPGDSRVIQCLQSNMHKGHFPPGCAAAMRELTDRAATKYSLNYALRTECQEDAEQLCANAVDELGMGRKAVTGKSTSHSEETTLACLARQAVDLAPTCKSELQALVKLSLNRYRVGMPLTSQCDGDVLKWCQVDKQVAVYLQSGYVLSCLAKHAAQLYKPCWELVSTMDEGQFRHAASMESISWRPANGAGGGVLDEKLLARVAADVRRELEPKLVSSLSEQVTRNVHVVTKSMSGMLASTIAPKVNALLHTTVSLLAMTMVGLVGAVLVWRKYARKGGVLVVRKDGRV
ncbi:hypothetical protein HYH03_000320 [Edaphochlamys debaryana]|uniref:Golgi apparatus protein 1 n=1 Tax=Edaphochlamys debaryana TaxID=47281 RepID=A0A836C623_9CHLO|nr:hypothetical protein HYH03_000320 [Edaphochlamys debaryana]|eukprot:KAG2501821.1 hypothetical protein HYH03_000320 [Edaphochlamys debaryana]